MSKALWAILLAVLSGCNGGGGVADGGLVLGDGAPGDGAMGDGGLDDGGAADGGGAPCETPCDDGDPCTEDFCDDGTCRARPRACDDGVQCTADRCEPGPICPDGAAPVDGGCQFVMRAQPLDAQAAFDACAAYEASPITIADADQNAAWRERADAVCGADVPLFLALRVAEDGRVTWPAGAEAVFTAWGDEEPRADVEGGHVEAAAGGAWRLRPGPVLCFACQGPPQPYACVGEPGDPEVLARPEQCNADDDDCDGQTDEDPDGTLCDDGNACTLDTCDGPLGCAHYEPAGQCDDGVACTVDRCDAAQGCVNEPDHALCDDGVACTVDTCNGEGCAFEPSDRACDDGIPCTVDRCDAVAGCVHEPMDARCDDQIDCTADACVVGVGCAYTPQNDRCDDGDGCTDDVCDPANGCENPFNTAPCDDGEICTPVDRCDQGVCRGQGTLRCDDGLPCTADQCAPGVGCVAPPEDECDHPGPLAGYFVGTFEGSGEVMPRFLPDVNWHASGGISAVVDASLTPSFQGYGEGQMAYDIPVLFDARYENVQPGRMSGALQDQGIAGFIHVAQVNAPWNPTYVFEDGVLVEITGETAGTVPTRDVLISVLGDGALVNLIANASPAASPYRFRGTLRRVVLEGQCCAPDGGCEPTTDLVCHRRGWHFAPNDAGRCCQGDVCQSRNQAECSNLGGTFVAARQGACCDPAGTGCNVANDTLCGHVGGRHVVGLTCEDANDDGLADGCGAPADYGYADPPGCALSPDRRVLTARVADLFDLQLEGTWVADGQDFVTQNGAGLVTPLGTIPLPGASLRVGCGDRFSLIGTVESAPALASLPAFPGVEMDVPPRRYSAGFGYGYELRAPPAELEGPFADGRPYLFVGTNSGTNIDLGDGVSISAEAGDQLTVAIDPVDPGFVIEVGGERLQRAAGNLINSVGLGLSRGGHLTWKSALDLPGPEGLGPRVETGHIWRSGEFALIPIPGLPGNLFVDGELLVDVGAAVDHLQPVAEALFSGDPAVLAQSLVAAGDPLEVADVLGDLRFAGNVNALTLSVGPFNITLGQASFTQADGALDFRGTGFTPGAVLAQGDAGALFEAFSAITLQATGEVIGHVDGDGFHVEVEADLVAGPFVLEDARLLLDSGFGIRIEGGRFALDFTTFMNALRTLMDCDFDADGAVCRFAGVEIGRLAGSLTDQGFRLDARLRLGVFNEVEFGAVVQANGRFTLQGSYQNGIPGLQTQSVRFQLSEAGVALQTAWAQLGQSIHLSGSMTLAGQFTLTGRGAVDIRGFEVQSLEVTVDSRSGLTGVGRMTVLPPQAGAGEASVTLTVPFNSPAWTLTGRADLAPFGYRLAEVRVDARGNDNRPGLELSGVVGIEDATLRLTGSVTPAALSLSGRANLSFRGIGLQDATVTLNNDGLRVGGSLDFGFFRAAVAGLVLVDGSFQLCTDGRVGVPFAGANLQFAGCLVRYPTFVLQRFPIPALAASGNATVRFAGVGFDGWFQLVPGGAPDFGARVEIDAGFGPGDVEGHVDLRLEGGRLAASFGGEACIEVNYVFGSEDVCVGASGSVDSSGRVCLGFPWPVGTECIDIL
ncbi:MAG: hypothetical protein H6706_02465 [Myxococcales bacterium]|nr:hypothetical protein [Myxococcales bacterium]